MYKIYYTDPKQPHEAQQVLVAQLSTALKTTQDLRDGGMVYVTLVTDYHDMVGQPGARMASGEYVPQLKN